MRTHISQILARLIHKGFNHMAVWINAVKPILEKGKPIVRWGHKAIPIFLSESKKKIGTPSKAIAERRGGSSSRIAWLQKGGCHEKRNFKLFEHIKYYAVFLAMCFIRYNHCGSK